jgi:8-oxo-dGTP pyrophosphatase MutT (NUDIX family)
MQNFEFEYEGKKYWYSRSVAVLGMILGYKNGDLYLLATKRGKGTPDFQGYWCMPCGYLDYNETTEEAIVREVYEETGIKIDIDLVKLHSIDSIPDDVKQNVTIRYVLNKDINIDEYSSLVEPDINEVEEISWISLSNIENYKWAFGHLDLIKKILA